jgi:hypothetical protein
VASRWATSHAASSAHSRASPFRGTPLTLPLWRGLLESGEAQCLGQEGPPAELLEVGCFASMWIGDEKIWCVLPRPPIALKGQWPFGVLLNGTTGPRRPHEPYPKSTVQPPTQGLASYHGPEAVIREERPRGVVEPASRTCHRALSPDHAGGQATRQHVNISTDVAHTFWDADMPMLWGEVHLPHVWHLSPDRVLVPSSGWTH